MDTARSGSKHTLHAFTLNLVLSCLLDCVAVLVSVACVPDMKAVETADPPAKSAGAPASTSSLTTRDEALLKIMADGDVPGLGIARVESGRLGWTTSLGRRQAMNLAPGAPAVDEQTVFEGASLGKPIVALAALQLVERGELQLDTTAESIVPLAGPSDPRKALITIRMLLSHTSGLAFGEAKLDADPGNRFSYSTAGYRYLQQVLEAKLGESLEDWAQRTLFVPLKMKHTSFVYGDRFAGNRAQGRNWLMVGQENMTNAAGTGAFDLITTPHDYATLWAAVLSGKVLSDATRALMFHPQKAIASEFFDATVAKKSPTELACGLGILLQKQNGKWIGFQWGDNGGTTGLLLIDPEKRDAVVFMSNAQDGLHAAEALALHAGMKDEAMTWVGYEPYNTRARVIWKQLTAACDRSAEEAIVEYQALLTEDYATTIRLSRNLGYFNRFKGRVIESEPFFRNASTVDTTDSGLLMDWSEALVISAKVEEAAAVQAKAAEIDTSLATKATLPAWISAAKADLANPAILDKEQFARFAGKYGDYTVELGKDDVPAFITPRGRRILVPTSSNTFLSSDMVLRVQLSEVNVSLTVAGQAAQVISKSQPPQIVK
jgi:CubicO group peptidase (beta-lactamase class C family)